MFMAQFKVLEQRVLLLKEKVPKGFVKKNETKRFAAIVKLIFEVVPNGPTLVEYQQGHTLGDIHKHRFRAQFFQQYRLFFRFHQLSKAIVYCWVYDEKNKRAYGTKTDAYRVFGKMLKAGHPPDDSVTLLDEAQGK